MPSRRDPTGPSLPTIKRLFAHSGNRCAFPRCTAALFEGATGIGEVCHIKAENPGGPRYDPQQTPAERHGYDNLILMCANHHTVIDDDEEAYTVERLLKLKAEHEQRAAPMDDALADRAAQFLINQPVTSVNQSGGFTAHTINYYPSTEASPVHERQVETLRKLVRQLRESHDWFKDTVRRARFEADPSMDECCRQCMTALGSAQETLADGRLFIPLNLADECEGFFNTLSQGLRDFAFARNPNTPNGPPRGAYWDAASKTAYEELPTRLDRIEKTARNLVKPPDVTPTPITTEVSNPLQIEVGEHGPFFSTRGKGLHRSERQFNIKIENMHERHPVTGCKVYLLEIEPSEYMGPWLLKEGFSLAAGDHTFIPFVTYGEAREPKYRSGDSFMVICVPEPSPKPSARSTHMLTLKATSLDTAPCEFRCKLWVDEAGRLRIARI